MLARSSQKLATQKFGVAIGVTFFTFGSNKKGCIAGFEVRIGKILWKVYQVYVLFHYRMLFFKLTDGQCRFHIIKVKSPLSIDIVR